MSARRGAWALLLMGVLVLLALSGCGGSKGSTSTVSSTRGGEPLAESRQQSADRASIAMRTAARGHTGEIEPHYTCRGANESIPLEWAGVGADAKEVVLLVRSLGQSLNSARVDWAVAGIAPSLQEVAAGKLPAGAIVGRNYLGQVGYSLCPVKGVPRTIVTINVLAYPKKLGLKQGFNVNEIGSKVVSGGVEWGSVLAYVT